MKARLPQQVSGTSAIGIPLNLLNEIFIFRHIKPSSSQNESTISSLIALLISFCDNLSSVTRRQHLDFSKSTCPLDHVSQNELDLIRKSLNHLSKPRNQGGPAWFPGYGCSILSVGSNIGNYSEFRIVGLDCWKHATLRARNGTAHVAIPTGKVELHLDAVHPDKVADFWDAFDALLSRASSRVNDKRSAAGGRQGHQKTPSFIESIARDSLISGNSINSTPFGACTDVGLHTGGEPYATCWPLVHFCLLSVLCNDSELADRFILNFKLFLLESHTEQIATSRPLHPRSIDMVVTMMNAILDATLKLDLEYKPFSGIANRIRAVRETLNHMTEADDAALADRFKVVFPKTLPEHNVSRPDLSSDVFNLPVESTSQTEDLERRTLMNIRALPRFPDNPSSFREALNWMDSNDRFNDGRDREAVLYVLAQIDRLFTLKTVRFEMNPLSDDDISVIKTIVTKYSCLLDIWINHGEATKSQMSVILRSRQLLLSWIAYCLVHQQLVINFPLMKEYNIPLDETQLKYAVLNENEAVNALKRVFVYIRSFKKFPLILFSLSQPEGTIAFAEKFATSPHGLYMQKGLAHCRKSLANDKAVFLSKVKEKHTKVEYLKSITPSLEKDVRNAEEEVSAAYFIRGNNRTFTINHWESILQTAKTRLHSHLANIEDARKVPPFVVSPLPLSDHQSLTVLFFFHMPSVIERLCALCLMAQDMMVPRPPSPETADAARELCMPFRKSCASIFESFGGVSVQSLEDVSYIIAPVILPERPQSYGPAVIDYIHSIDHVANSTWYVDFSTFTLSSKYGTNPFAISSLRTERFYTPLLPAGLQDLQWAVNYPTTAEPAGQLSRGNIAFSKQNLVVQNSFTKKEFLTFGAVRSYEYQQLRKVVNALDCMESLPLAHPAVQVLLRITAFQVGPLEIGVDLKIRLRWRKDMELFGGLAALQQALSRRADSLAPLIRDYEKIAILADLASFTAQLSGDGSIRRKFCDIAIDWSSIVGNDMENKPPDERLLLRAKQCLMIGYGILCRGPFGEISEEDAELLIRLSVEFTEGMVYAFDSTIKDTLVNIRVQVQEVLSSRVSTLIQYVESSDGYILTRAVRKYLNVGDNLKWEQLKGRSHCYQSRGISRHYCINVLNGIILFDGLPPGRLPTDILQSKMFIRVFGHRNFEVSANGDWLETQIFDKYFSYRFASRNGAVLIEEIDARSGDKFSLIELPEQWRGLPVRIREMHSAWYCKEKQLLVFRPIIFSSREIDFFATVSAPMTAYMVPHHQRTLQVNKLFEMRGSLLSFINEDSTTSDVLLSLRKFEDADFIHILQDPKDLSIVFHLPRYCLNFRVNKKSAVCMEHSGFALACEQQLPERLHGFSRYLILEQSVAYCNNMITQGRNRRIVMPDGIIFTAPDCGVVDIVVNKSCDAIIGHFRYDFDARTGEFNTNVISARLQLAALHAAIGTLLPNEGGLTGTEVAMNAVRRSWVNRPLSADERSKLEMVKEFSFSEPALSVLCDKLDFESRQLSFLHGQSDASDAAIDVMYRRQSSMDSESEYDQWLSSDLAQNTLRKSLRSFEMAASRFRKRPVKSYLPRNITFIDDLPPLPVNESIVEDIEKSIRNLVARKRQDPRRFSKFPLPMNKSVTKVDLEIWDGLRASWNEFTMLPHCTPRAESKILIARTQARVQEEIKKLRDYLQNAALIAPSKKWGGLNNFIRDCNRAPSLSFNDLLIAAYDLDTLLCFNPFLSITAALQFQNANFIYLKLIVLCDRLERILECIRDSSETALLQELSTWREWDARSFPEWLVFEVEGRIQVRPEQYAMVDHLVRNPGSISQLNMGLGKTRVILPLLIMYYRQRADVGAGRGLPRVMVLSQLYSEVYEYMHLTLTNSVLGITILEQPFVRGILLTPERLKIMQSFLSGAGMRRNAFLLVTPASALSLDLKLQEMVFYQDLTTSALKSFLEVNNFIDILDESDELLSHRYQLIYAIGAVHSLDSCETRFVCAEAVLRAINAPDSELARLLNIEGFSTRTVKDQPGVYDSVYLSAESESNKTLRARLRELIYEQLAANHPFELKEFFAKAEKSRNLITSLRHFILDAANKDAATVYDGLRDEGLYAIALILRGLLGLGLLEHALNQRNRVNYGLDVNRYPKRLAVPFRAADVPSERSEFNHPDISILLTVLAYYHDGLTKMQVREAIGFLLNMGSIQQERCYDAWIKPVLPHLTGEEKSSFGRVELLDLTNELQFAMLYSKLRFGTELINFFLNYCVLRIDTGQYSQRIVGNAWNLAKGGHVIGFSGTNDNQCLLPLQVKQFEPEITQIRSTNGMMLEKLIRYTKSFQSLDHNGPLWSNLLEFTLTNGYDALIDTGSLLAGVSNTIAAEYIANHKNFHSRFRGVHFFDDGGWKVLDRQTRQTLPKGLSNIHESESFVLFDDARTRGVDMKLHRQVVAVVTLGPMLAKDKLIQGVGRLRKLGCDQRIVPVSTSDLAVAIKLSLGKKPTETLEIRGILKWVLRNTASAIEHGLSMWSRQGLNFLSNPEAPIDEDWTLKTLYGSPVVPERLTSIISTAATKCIENPEISKILQRVDSLADGLEVTHSSGNDEECLRELQLEEEEEEEVEIEIPALSPYQEPVWNYGAVSRAREAPELSREVEILTLQRAVDKVQCPPRCSFDLQHISWKDCNVWVTKNFLQTVNVSDLTQHSSETNLATIDFLRPCDSALVFRHSILLLSDQEADGILGHLCNSAPTLQNLSFCFVNIAQLKISSRLTGLTKIAMGAGKEGVAYQKLDLIATQLYNGDTGIADGTDEQLSQLLNHPGAKIAVRELVNARGEGRNWDRCRVEEFFASWISQVED